MSPQDQQAWVTGLPLITIGAAESGF